MNRFLRQYSTYESISVYFMWGFYCRKLISVCILRGTFIVCIKLLTLMVFDIFGTQKLGNFNVENLFCLNKIHYLLHSVCFIVLRCKSWQLMRYYRVRSGRLGLIIICSWNLHKKYFDQCLRFYSSLILVEATY